VSGSSDEVDLAEAGGGRRCSVERRRRQTKQSNLLRISDRHDVRKEANLSTRNADTLQPAANRYAPGGVIMVT